MDQIGEGTRNCELQICGRVWTQCLECPCNDKGRDLVIMSLLYQAVLRLQSILSLLAYIRLPLKQHGDRKTRSHSG